MGHANVQQVYEHVRLEDHQVVVTVHGKGRFHELGPVPVHVGDDAVHQAAVVQYGD